MLQEHRRVLAAEADRLELENRETLARVALVEEENQRERDKALGSRAVARLEFGMRSALGGDKELTSVKVCCLLKRTPGDQRTMEISVAQDDGASVTNKANITSIESFLENWPSVQLWMRPWLQGAIDDQQLSGIERDDVFRGIKFSPGAMVEAKKASKTKNSTGSTYYN